MFLVFIVPPGMNPRWVLKYHCISMFSGVITLLSSKTNWQMGYQISIHICRDSDKATIVYLFYKSQWNPFPFLLWMISHIRQIIDLLLLSIKDFWSKDELLYAYAFLIEGCKIKYQYYFYERTIWFRSPLLNDVEIMVEIIQ